MHNTLVTDGIYRLSAATRDILFEGLWPLPNGVSMNSYIVKGEKVAIVDGVCGWDGVPESLYRQLAEMDIRVEDIDYVVINHMEPDHSGWLESFVEMTHDFEIVASQKAIELARAFYQLDDRFRFRAVKSGDSLDLGGGKRLLFEEIPNVHWPETIATYEVSTQTLMPCDAFGSFGAVADDAPYDDQMSEEELDFFETETVRYYANIVSAFSIPVRKAIEKLAPLKIRTIAPGHGIVWRKDPGRILRLYSSFSHYAQGPAEQRVTVLWGSMYGMTARGIEPVVEGIRSQGVEVDALRVPETNLSFVLASAFQSSGIVVACPTYEYRLFSPMAHALDDLGRKRISNRKAFYFGSYGWSGGALKELGEIVEKYRMNWDFLDPVTFNGVPTSDTLDLIYRRGQELALAVKEIAPAAA